MTKTIRATALGLLAAIGLTLGATQAAEASSKGRRNTAIAAGAVGIYGLVKKKPILAGAGLGVAGYSYASSLRKRDQERRRARYRRHYRRPARYYRRR